MAAAPTPDTSQAAKRLLRDAQRRRAARDWQGALKAYRLLIQRYPRSAEARAAQVSVGYIQLDALGRPAAALRAFNRYLALAKRGILAQEAAYGRARALRALGRRQAELAALKDFLRRFPAALQAQHVRRRLRKLGELKN